MSRRSLVLRSSSSQFNQQTKGTKEEKARSKGVSESESGDGPPGLLLFCFVGLLFFLCRFALIASLSVGLSCCALSRFCPRQRQKRNRFVRWLSFPPFLSVVQLEGLEDRRAALQRDVARVDEGRVAGVVGKSVCVGRERTRR